MNRFAFFIYISKLQRVLDLPIRLDQDDPVSTALRSSLLDDNRVEVNKCCRKPFNPHELLYMI